MWGALIFGLLFLAGAASNIVGPEPDYAEAAAGAAIGAALLGLFFFSRTHARRGDELPAWLLRNAAEIERTGLHYESRLNTPTTVLVRYQVALSFLIVTFKLPMRPYVEGEDPIFVVATLATVVSLLFGWWGIPWGPVYTVQVVDRTEKA